MFVTDIKCHTQTGSKVLVMSRHVTQASHTHTHTHTYIQTRISEVSKHECETQLGNVHVSNTSDEL